jgi:hypothetical protein
MEEKRESSIERDKDVGVGQWMSLPELEEKGKSPSVCRQLLW